MEEKWRWIEADASDVRRMEGSEGESEMALLGRKRKMGSGG
jgi:hypothetical protein